MKVFQILSGFCHWDATKDFPTLASTVGFFAPDIVFIEAPDHVFEGWGYIDGEFIKPELPEPTEWVDEETGETYHWVYDDATGTFYIADESGEPIEADELAKAIAAKKKAEERADDAESALEILGVEREAVDDETRV